MKDEGGGMRNGGGWKVEVGLGWRIFNHEWARMGTNREGTVDN